MSRLKFFLLLASLGASVASPAQYPAPVDAQSYSPAEQLRQIVIDQSQLLENLRTEVQRLVGDNELLLYKLEQIEKRQREVYSNMDERLRKLEQGQTGITAAPAAAAPPPPVNAPPVSPPSTASTESTPSTTPPPPPAAPAAPSPQDKAAYEQSFANLQGGRFSQAITGFKTLLKTSPQGQYADNAQYWLGESYYATRDFPAALAAFSQVVDNYPDSAKRSHALLKLGYVHYEMNNKPMARQVLEQVSKTYPGTATARMAEERLQKMRQEGN